MTQLATAPVEKLRETLGLIVQEGRRRVVVLAALFAAIALAALAVGVLKPKEYEAQAVILVEAKNIIAPLMEGRAVATGVTDQASIVSQAMWSRRILREVLAYRGWAGDPDPRAEERELARLAGRIRIVRQRPELIKLAYVDTDPERSYAIAKKLAEIYIREALGGKSRQSSAAFEFIDRQVTEYAAKMADAHAKMQSYYREHGDPRQTVRAAPPAARSSGPRLSGEELAKLRAEEARLSADLASREQRQRRRAERVEQLHRDLDALRGTYTEKHPSVRRASDELEKAKQEDARATAAEERPHAAARSRLEEVRSRLAAAAATDDALTRAGAVLPGAEAPSPVFQAQLLAAQDERLSDLIRRYESTRDVYQDLLKRRENARVSMELDAEQRGLTLRVYEEPEVPVLPIGLRLMHVILIGLVVGVLAPIGLLFAIVKFDPRVRSAQQLDRLALAPLLVTIPYSPTSGDRARQRRRVLIAMALVAAVFATYAVFFFARMEIDVRQIVAGLRLPSS